MGSALGSEPHVGRGSDHAQYVVRRTSLAPRSGERVPSREAARRGRGAPHMKLDRRVEARLYLADLDRAAPFYEEVLGLTQLTRDARFRAYDVGGQSVLLLFRRGATLETVRMPGGTIPPHDGHGPLHMAFAITTDELPQWEGRLREQGIA